MQLSHLGLPVRDYQRSLRFYADYFGFDPATAQEYSDGTVIVRNADGFDLALHPVEDVEALPAFLHAGFRAAEPAEVRTLLAKFGLKSDHVLRSAATLSPGERTRAALALLQAKGVNLLVLDKPTNHLDLAAIEQLEAALANYPGTLLLVTHDRRMLEAVQTTRRLSVDGGKVTEV